MSPNLTELVNEYYEARKPYTQLLREAHANPPSTHSSPETAEAANDMLQSESESLFSVSPGIPKDEIKDLLQKMEAAKIEYRQGDKATAAGASAQKKGKAPEKKK